MDAKTTAIGQFTSPCLEQTFDLNLRLSSDTTQGRRCLQLVFARQKKTVGYIPMEAGLRRTLLISFEDPVVTPGYGRAACDAIVGLGFNSAISSCAGFDVASQLRSDMKSRGLAEDEYTFNALVSACERSRRWDSALALVEEMLQAGLRPSVVTCSAAISACDKGQRWEWALQLLQDMPSARLRLRPNTFSYAAAVSACEACRQWEWALQVFGESLRASCPPSVVSYGAALSACEKGGCWDGALWLLADMSRRNLSPNTIVCNAAISACARSSGKWQNCLALLASLPGLGLAPELLSCGAAVHGCAAAGRWSLVLQLLGDMRELEIRPDAPVLMDAFEACEALHASSSMPALSASVQDILAELTLTRRRLRAASTPPAGADQAVVSMELLHEAGCSRSSQSEAFRRPLFASARSEYDNITAATSPTSWLQSPQAPPASAVHPLTGASVRSASQSARLLLPGRRLGPFSPRRWEQATSSVAAETAAVGLIAGAIAQDQSPALLMAASVVYRHSLQSTLAWDERPQRWLAPSAPFARHGHQRHQQVSPRRHVAVSPPRPGRFGSSATGQLSAQSLAGSPPRTSRTEASLVAAARASSGMNSTYFMGAASLSPRPSTAMPVTGRIAGGVGGLLVGSVSSTARPNRQASYAQARLSLGSGADEMWMRVRAEMIMGPGPRSVRMGAALAATREAAAADTTDGVSATSALHRHIQSMAGLLQPVGELGSDGSSCAICLGADAEDVVQLRCGNQHRFHRSCITTWMVASMTLEGGMPRCPLCRKRVVDSSEMVDPDSTGMNAPRGVEGRARRDRDVLELSLQELSAVERLLE
ncbi:unnamed protein product, partial [Polarella glacialis]